jgi:hypothetical protein
VNEPAISQPDSSIIASGESDPAKQDAAIFEPEQVGLAIQPRIVSWRPRKWNDFLSFADLTEQLALPFADWTINFGCSTADFASPDINRFSVLHYDYIPDMILIPSLIPSLAGRELLPEVARAMAGDVHMDPSALGQFQARPGTIDFSSATSSSGAGYHPAAVTLETRLFSSGGDGSLLVGSIRRRRGVL